LIYQDPPNHSLVRKSLNEAFPMEAVSALAPNIESIVGDVLDECAERGTFDLIRDFSAPLTIMVLADAMGLPRDDRAQFRRWSTRLAPLVDGSIRASFLDDAAQAAGETAEYLTRVIRARRANPGDDLISRLIATGDDGAPSELDLLSTCVFLLTAGHESCGLLLGNAVVALLEHPSELERLRNTPSLGALAVEEFLRFDSPVQVASRKPVEDVSWASVTFPKGCVINLLLGSANRDPAQFSDPDRLDVGRTRNPHLAFSTSIHFCAGTGLARLEVRIALQQLLKRFPNLALGPAEPIRRPGAVLRGFLSLPVQA
jgi:cytochrome P450